MQYLTAEQIAQKADHLDGPANINFINNLFRDQDESHLWPILNKFNVTEKAIEMAMQYDCSPGIEYACVVDNLIGEIVNDPQNH